MKYILDAKKKKVGRVASEAASILMGKNTSSYVRNSFPADVMVEIVNVSQSEISPKKVSKKTYAKYSGYPGGLRHEKMETVIEKKGKSEVFKLAVYGMLPSNKLRPRMMKRLVIKD
ncbi:MAG: uL13 family ribosomal protein [Candidatus Taylorbacteria bacterium]